MGLSSEGGYDCRVRTSPGRILLTAVYAFINVGAAHAAESAFWSERRRSSRDRQSSLLAQVRPPMAASLSAAVALPPLGPGAAAALQGSIPEISNASEGIFSLLTPDLGTVQSVTDKARPDQPTVLFVQDLHQNEGAQRNIGKVLRRMTEAGRLDWVALEGDTGPIQFGRWRTYPRRNVVLDVADFLLTSHRISGPVHDVLVSTAAPAALDGVDDPSLYAANVDAYLRARGSAPRLRKELSQRRIAHRAGISRLNPSLRVFVGSVQAFDNGKASLGVHARAMASLLPVTDLAPAFREFLRVLEMESALDFPRIEADRSRVLSELTERLTPFEKERLLNDSVAFRSGRLRHDRFYEALRRLLTRKGVVLSADFARYVEYVVRAGRINGADLQRALRRVEKEVRARWGRTDFEKAWLEEDLRLARDQRLVDFALTPVDWEEHRTVARPDVFAPFADFYRTAEARDRAMAARVIAGVKERRARLTLLVAGGFHGDGLTAALEAAGLAVVRFVPRVETVGTPSGEAALSIFAQEKLPLERIAAGEKLFLAPPPAAGMAEAPFYAAALDPEPANALRILYEGIVPLKGARMEGDLIPHLHAEFDNGDEINVHVFYDARGKPSFRQRAAANARDVLWAPVREWPATARALFNQAAFLDFLRSHPVVVRSAEPEQVDAAAERIFRRRFAGLSRWLPTGATVGLGFGLGVAGTVLALWGGGWVAQGLLPFVLNLTALAGVSIGLGFSAGLILAHALYNLVYPDARLALPGDVLISLDPGLRARVNNDPGLRAVFTGLGSRLGRLSRRVVIQTRPASGIQLARDRSGLLIFLNPDAGRGPGEIHRAITNELSRMERFLADTRGGAVYAIPVKHETEADFPAATLDALPYPLLFIEEYGSVFPHEELLDAFRRNPKGAESLLFAGGEETAPLDLDALRREPDRMRRWVTLWGPQNESAVKMLRERTAALARGDEADFLKVGAEGDFGRVRRQWLFNNRRRIALVAEPFTPDVDFFIAQSVFLTFGSWEMGPWSIPRNATEPAPDRVMERALQTFLVLAKATFLRNERLKEHLRQTPIDPDRRGVFVVGAAHRLGLQNELFEWAPEPVHDDFVRRYFELPSGKLEAELQNHLLKTFPHPTPQDLSVFSDWVRRLSVFRPTLSPDARRWLMEWVLARWLRETRRRFLPSGEGVAPNVEAVEEAIHALSGALSTARLENWIARATLDFDIEGKNLWGEFSEFLDGKEVPAEARRVLQEHLRLRGGPPPLANPDAGPAELRLVAAAAESVATDIARSLAVWLPQFQEAARQSQTQKEDGSWLSDADVFATRMIVGGLLHAFPSHGVVVEEDLESVDPALAARAAANAGSPYVWHVDPLDGSESYLRGNDVYAVHIALTFRGDPVASVVALPGVRGMDGKPLVIAARKDRPGLVVNGREFQPRSTPAPPTDLARLSAMAHGKAAIGRVYPHLSAAQEKCRAVFERAGSSGYWLTALALSRVGIPLPGVPEDFAVFASNRLKSWDIVAPGVLIQAVGGRVEGHAAGDPYFPVTTVEPEESVFILAALSPDHARLWRSEVIEAGKSHPPRAGPAPGTVEVVNPERVAAASVRLCFFDVNGTLWRGYPFGLKATLWARYLYRTPIPLPHQTREIQAFLADIDWMNVEDQERELERFAQERRLPRVLIPRGKNWSENVVRTAVNQAMLRNAQPAAVIPGLTDLLSALQRAGVGLEVSTSGNAGTRRRVLEGLGVASFFSRVHGGGHKEEVIAERLAEEKSEGRHAVMIGDGPGDMAAARQNGALAVGIVTGPAHAEKLRATGADVLVYGDYSDTAALLNVLGVGRAAPPTPRPTPDSVFPQNLPGDVPASDLFHALSEGFNGEQIETLPADAEGRPWPDGMTVKKLSVGPYSDKPGELRAGWPALLHELYPPGKPGSSVLLVYESDRLVAVFPESPNERRWFLDLSRYYAPLPKPGRGDPPISFWTETRRNVERLRPALAELEKRYVRERQDIDGEGDYLQGAIDLSLGTRQFEALHARPRPAGLPSHGFGVGGLPTADPERRWRFVVPKFPTVYSPAGFQMADGAFWALLLGRRPRDFRLNAAPEAKSLVLGTGTGLDALTVALQTEGEVWVTDVNPFALANARFVFRLFGLEGRLQTRLVDNAADAAGVPHFLSAEGDPIRFDNVVWNMPSHADRNPRRADTLQSRWDILGDDLLKTFSTALPALLAAEGQALIWNIEAQNEAGHDIVWRALTTGGGYFRDQESPPVMSVSVHGPVGSAVQQARSYVVKHRPPPALGEEREVLGADALREVLARLTDPRPENNGWDGAAEEKSYGVALIKKRETLRGDRKAKVIFKLGVGGRAFLITLTGVPAGSYAVRLADADDGPPLLYLTEPATGRTWAFSLEPFRRSREERRDGAAALLADPFASLASARRDAPRRVRLARWLAQRRAGGTDPAPADLDMGFALGGDTRGGGTLIDPVDGKRLIRLESRFFLSGEARLAVEEEALRVTQGGRSFYFEVADVIKQWGGKLERRPRDTLDDARARKEDQDTRKSLARLIGDLWALGPWDEATLRARLTEFNQAAFPLIADKLGTIRVLLSGDTARRLRRSERAFFSASSLRPNGTYRPQWVYVAHRGPLLILQDVAEPSKLHALALGRLHQVAADKHRGGMVSLGVFRTEADAVAEAALTPLGVAEEAAARRSAWAAGAADDLESLAAAFNEKKLVATATMDDGQAFFLESAFSGNIRRVRTKSHRGTRWALSILLSPAGPWLVARSIDNNVKEPLRAYGPLLFEGGIDEEIDPAWRGARDMSLEAVAKELARESGVEVVVPRMKEPTGAPAGIFNTDDMARAALGDWADSWAGKSPSERRGAFAEAVRDFRERLSEGGAGPDDLRRRRESIVAHDVIFNGKTPAEAVALYGGLLAADESTLALYMSREGDLEKRRAVFSQQLAALAQMPLSSPIQNPRFAQFEAAMDRLAPPLRGFALREGGLLLLAGLAAPLVAIGLAAAWVAWDLGRHGRSGPVARWTRRAAAVFARRSGPEPAPSDLDTFSAAASRDVKAALSARSGSVSRLRAFLPPITGRETGRVLVIDWGGTRVKFRSVRLLGDGAHRVERSAEFVFTAAEKAGPGRALFDRLAAEAAAFADAEPGLTRTAFVFSFPGRQTALDSAVLERWTKEVTASGVEGEDVVRLLREALARRGSALEVAAVVNDAVGALAAGTYADAAARPVDAGLILGTGINAAVFADGDAVNLELGQWRPGRSLPEGASKTTLERAVAALYIGDHVRKALEENGTREGWWPRGAVIDNAALSPEHLSPVLQDGSADRRTVRDFALANLAFPEGAINPEVLRRIQETVRSVIDRSARLAAAAVAGVLSAQETSARPRRVVVDGSFYTKTPGYAARFEDALRARLGPDGPPVRVRALEDATTLGAAVVAAAAKPDPGSARPADPSGTALTRAVHDNIAARPTDLGVGRSLRFETLSRTESWAAALLKPAADLVGIQRLRRFALLGWAIPAPFLGARAERGGADGRRPVVFVLVSRSMASRLDGAVERALRASTTALAEVVLLPVDSEGREALARTTFASPRVRVLADLPRRSSGSTLWDLGDLERFVADRVDLSRYTDGRLLATADVAFVAGSSRSALFRNALVQLLDLWFPVTMSLRRWDQIHRVFQAIAAAA